MIKGVQDNTKKIITYVLSGLLILGVLLVLSGCSDEDDANYDLAYNPKQVRAYSKKTLSKLYKNFPKKTAAAKKFEKSKDNNYRNYILSTALQKSDFNTLIAICRDSPTRLHKAYVFACGWSIEYDKSHLPHYTKCLIYYRDRFSAKEKRNVTAPLDKVISSCTYDLTGEQQKRDAEYQERHRDHDYYMPYYMYYDDDDDDDDDYISSSRSSNSNSEDEDEEESSNSSSSESEEEENSSSSTEEESPTESEPEESVSSEPEE